MRGFHSQELRVGVREERSLSSSGSKCDSKHVTKYGRRSWTSEAKRIYADLILRAKTHE